MLWMKAWLEMKWRLLFGLGLSLAVVLSMSAPQNRQGMTGILFLFMFAPVYLAGSGIQTQAAFRATRGLHGSTFFTLSLPVSRLRLLAIRVGLGMAATTGVIAIVICIVWLRFPIVRGDSTLADLIKLVATAIVCTACFHFLSVTLSTLLDDVWRLFASMIAISAVWWTVGRLSLPPSANIFDFLGNASPLVTHTFPWPAMVISVAASVILFVAALKVVQAREY
jgi:hypothetical protein